MTTFIASDIHLSHKNILQYCPHRRQGKDMPTEEDAVKSMVNSMNELIISNWNSVVEPEDETYILGDVAMSIIANAPPLIRRLNGKKYLIAGNHDKTLRKLIKNSYHELYDLFEWIEDVHEMFVKINGKKIPVFMSHYPHQSYNYMNQGGIHFHGHLHGSPSGLIGRIKDCGIDTNNLYPYRLEAVVEEMLKIDVIRDHHEA